MTKTVYAQAFILFCCILLIGCKGNISTPKGIYKSFDLRGSLPPEVAQITDQQGIERVKEIPLGETDEKVILKWRTYQKDNKSYNLSANVEVPQELKGIELISAGIDLDNPLEINGEINQMSSLKIGWSDNGFPRKNSGVEIVKFLSNGNIQKFDTK